MPEDPTIRYLRDEAASNYADVYYGEETGVTTFRGAQAGQGAASYGDPNGIQAPVHEDPIDPVIEYPTKGTDYGGAGGSDYPPLNDDWFNHPTGTTLENRETGRLYTLRHKAGWLDAGATMGSQVSEDDYYSASNFSMDRGRYQERHAPVSFGFRTFEIANIPRDNDNPFAYLGVTPGNPAFSMAGEPRIAYQNTFVTPTAGTSPDFLGMDRRPSTQVTVDTPNLIYGNWPRLVQQDMGQLYEANDWFVKHPESLYNTAQTLTGLALMAMAIYPLAGSTRGALSGAGAIRGAATTRARTLQQQINQGINSVRRQAVSYVHGTPITYQRNDPASVTTRAELRTNYQNAITQTNKAWTNLQRSGQTTVNMQTGEITFTSSPEAFTAWRSSIVQRTGARLAMSMHPAGRTNRPAGDTFHIPRGPAPAGLAGQGPIVRMLAGQRPAFLEQQPLAPAPGMAASSARGAAVSTTPALGASVTSSSSAMATSPLSIFEPGGFVAALRGQRGMLTQMGAAVLVAPLRGIGLNISNSVFLLPAETEVTASINRAKAFLRGGSQSDHTRPMLGFTNFMRDLQSQSPQVHQAVVTQLQQWQQGPEWAKIAERRRMEQAISTGADWLEAKAGESRTGQTTRDYLTHTALPSWVQDEERAREAGIFGTGVMTGSVGASTPQGQGMAKDFERMGSSIGQPPLGIRPGGIVISPREHFQGSLYYITHNDPTQTEVRNRIQATLLSSTDRTGFVGEFRTWLGSGRGQQWWSSVIQTSLERQGAAGIVSGPWTASPQTPPLSETTSRDVLGFMSGSEWSEYQTPRNETGKYLGPHILAAEFMTFSESMAARSDARWESAFGGEAPANMTEGQVVAWANSRLRAVISPPPRGRIADYMDTSNIDLDTVSGRELSHFSYADQETGMSYIDHAGNPILREGIDKDPAPLSFEGEQSQLFSYYLGKGAPLGHQAVVETPQGITSSLAADELTRLMNMSESQATMMIREQIDALEYTLGLRQVQGRPVDASLRETWQDQLSYWNKMEGRLETQRQFGPVKSPTEETETSYKPGETIVNVSDAFIGAGRGTDPLRVLVTGSRIYRDRQNLFNVLDMVLKRAGSTGIELIHGGARGADSLANQWAIDRGIETTVFLPDWETHGRSAGYRRNEQMIEEGAPNLVVAFPQGEARGTANQMQLAREANIPVLIGQSLSGSFRYTPAPTGTHTPQSGRINVPGPTGTHMPAGGRSTVPGPSGPHSAFNELMDQGQSAVEAGDYTTASDLFRQARASTVPAPTGPHTPGAGRSTVPGPAGPHSAPPIKPEDQPSLPPLTTAERNLLGNALGLEGAALDSAILDLDQTLIQSQAEHGSFEKRLDDIFGEASGPTVGRFPNVVSSLGYSLTQSGTMRGPKNTRHLQGIDADVTLTKNALINTETEAARTDLTQKRTYGSGAATTPDPAEQGEEDLKYGDRWAMIDGQRTRWTVGEGSVRNRYAPGNLSAFPNLVLPGGLTEDTMRLGGGLSLIQRLTNEQLIHQGQEPVDFRTGTVSTFESIASPLDIGPAIARLKSAATSQGWDKYAYERNLEQQNVWSKTPEASTQRQAYRAAREAVRGASMLSVPTGTPDYGPRSGQQQAAVDQMDEPDTITRSMIPFYKQIKLYEDQKALARLQAGGTMASLPAAGFDDLPTPQGPKFSTHFGGAAVDPIAEPVAPRNPWNLRTQYWSYLRQHQRQNQLPLWGREQAAREAAASDYSTTTAQTEAAQQAVKETQAAEVHTALKSNSVILPDGSVLHPDGTTMPPARQRGAGSPNTTGVPAEESDPTRGGTYDPNYPNARIGSWAERMFFVRNWVVLTGLSGSRSMSWRWLETKGLSSLGARATSVLAGSRNAIGEMFGRQPGVTYQNAINYMIEIHGVEKFNELIQETETQQAITHLNNFLTSSDLEIGFVQGYVKDSIRNIIEYGDLITKPVGVLLSGNLAELVLNPPMKISRPLGRATGMWDTYPFMDQQGNIVPREVASQMTPTQLHANGIRMRYVSPFDRYRNAIWNAVGAVTNAIGGGDTQQGDYRRGIILFEDTAWEQHVRDPLAIWQLQQEGVQWHKPTEQDMGDRSAAERIQLNIGNTLFNAAQGASRLFIPLFTQPSWMTPNLDRLNYRMGLRTFGYPAAAAFAISGGNPIAAMAVGVAALASDRLRRNQVFAQAADPYRDRPGLLGRAARVFGHVQGDSSGVGPMSEDFNMFGQTTVSSYNRDMPAGNRASGGIEMEGDDTLLTRMAEIGASPPVGSSPVQIRKWHERRAEAIVQGNTHPMWSDTGQDMSPSQRRLFHGAAPLAADPGGDGTGAGGPEPPGALRFGAMAVAQATAGMGRLLLPALIGMSTIARTLHRGDSHIPDDWQSRLERSTADNTGRHSATDPGYHISMPASVQIQRLQGKLPITTPIKYADEGLEWFSDSFEQGSLHFMELTGIAHGITKLKFQLFPEPLTGLGHKDYILPAPRGSQTQEDAIVNDYFRNFFFPLIETQAKNALAANRNRNLALGKYPEMAPYVEFADSEEMQDIIRIAGSTRESVENRLGALLQFESLQPGGELYFGEDILHNIPLVGEDHRIHRNIDKHQEDAQVKRLENMYFEWKVEDDFKEHSGGLENYRREIVDGKWRNIRVGPLRPIVRLGDYSVPADTPRVGQQFLPTISEVADEDLMARGGFESSAGQSLMIGLATPAPADRFLTTNAVLYDRAVYGWYGQGHKETEIAALMGGIKSPYERGGSVEGWREDFESLGETQIEHRIALSTLHRMGLADAPPHIQQAAAADPLNLTLASPEINMEKGSLMTHEWDMPNASHRPADAAIKVEYMQKYNAWLTVPEEEAEHLDPLVAQAHYERAFERYVQKRGGYEGIRARQRKTEVRIGAANRFIAWTNEQEVKGGAAAPGRKPTADGVNTRWGTHYQWEDTKTGKRHRTRPDLGSGGAKNIWYPNKEGVQREHDTGAGGGGKTGREGRWVQVGSRRELQRRRIIVNDIGPPPSFPKLPKAPTPRRPLLTGPGRIRNTVAPGRSYVAGLQEAAVSGYNPEVIKNVSVANAGTTPLGTGRSTWGASRLTDHMFKGAPDKGAIIEHQYRTRGWRYTVDQAVKKWQAAMRRWQDRRYTTIWEGTGIFEGPDPAGGGPRPGSPGSEQWKDKIKENARKKFGYAYMPEWEHVMPNATEAERREAEEAWMTRAEALGDVSTDWAGTRVLLKDYLKDRAAGRSLLDVYPTPPPGIGLDTLSSDFRLSSSGGSRSGAEFRDTEGYTDVPKTPGLENLYTYTEEYGFAEFDWDATLEDWMSEGLDNNIDPKIASDTVNTGNTENTDRSPGATTALPIPAG